MVRADRSAWALVYVKNCTVKRRCDTNIQVIHPFHPRYGRRFELVEYKNAWGEDRVYFQNEEQQLIALPASWTDVVAADPFVSTAEGRAFVPG